jgi:hypothetical protein
MNQAVVECALCYVYLCIHSLVLLLEIFMFHRLLFQAQTFGLCSVML